MTAAPGPLTEFEVVALHLAAEAGLVLTSRPKRSGIVKAAVAQIEIDEAGVVGDTIVDKVHHGNVDQAVYLYAAEDYEWWSNRLGIELSPGCFGENITTWGVDLSAALVGDMLRFDGAELQVTSPRIPCDTFSAHMNQPDWIRRFRDAERPGVYCRVLQGGNVTVGQAAKYAKYQGPTIGVLEAQDQFYNGFGDRDDAFVARGLAGPLHYKERPVWEQEQLRRTAQREQAPLD